mmetsp:Transcript_18658/g.63022  ORF Transcript_18658/g.63022 Transcript_18658/m.63022 type:complete len:213 (-) Transcript_18658:722-1360(-)
MSRPRAATSVAIKILKAPLRNAAIVFSRRACGMSPCSARRSKRSLSESTISLHSFFVSQKMMLRFSPPPCAATTSLITSCICVQWPQGTHICLTSVEACIICSRPSERPTRSISVRCVAYSLAIFWTHGGNVAEKSSSCRFAPAPASTLPMALKILSSSSLKPMSSIWSASSRMAKSSLETSSFPFSIKSFVRPGVPTTTSTPRRSGSTWGP